MMSLHDSETIGPDASVIIVTHNNRGLIAQCLLAAKEGFESYSHEILIVDNGSTDGTLEEIPTDLEHCRVIALQTNLGFAQANNIGIEAALGRFIVLLNSDAFPDPGAIDRLIDALNELPRAGIVGARLRYPDGNLQPSISRFPSLLGSLWVAFFLHRAPLLARLNVGVNSHPVHYRTRRRVDWVTAAFCIARRETGQLPAETFMYGEDVNWAIAGHRRGLEVWFEPTATGIHIGRASVDQSQNAGFAQQRRVQFELAWFANRGLCVQLAARGVMTLHALMRLAFYGGLSAFLGHRDGRVGEYTALLRAALSKITK